MYKVEIILSLYFFLSWTVITKVSSESERKIVKLRDRVKRDVDILADCNDQCLSKDQTTDYDVLLEYDYGDGKPCIYVCKFLNVNKTEDHVKERFLPLKASKNRTSNYEIVGFSSFEKPYDEKTQNVIVTSFPGTKHVVPTKATTETSPATVKFETSNINVPLKVAVVPTSPVNQSRFLQTITNFSTASKEQNFQGTTTGTPLFSVVPVIPKVIRLSVLEAEMVKADSASQPSLKSFQVPGVSDFIYKTTNTSWPYSEKTISTFNTDMINRLNENQELNDVLNYQNTINEQDNDLLPKIKYKITSSSTASTPIVSLTSPNTRQSSFTSFTITLPTSKPGQYFPASIGSTKLVTALFDDTSKKFPKIVTSLWPERTSTLKSRNQYSQTVSTAIDSTVSTNLNGEAMLPSVVTQTVKLSTERSITPELSGVTDSINKPVHFIPSSINKILSFIKQNTFMSTAPVFRSSSDLDSVTAESSKKVLLSAQTEYGSTFSTVHANLSKLIGSRFAVSTAPKRTSDNDSTPSMSTLPVISNAQIDVGSPLSKLHTSSSLIDSGPTMTLEPAKSGEFNASEPKFVSIQTDVSKQIDLDLPLSTIPTNLSEFDPLSTLSTIIASSSVNNPEFTLSTIPVSLSKQTDLLSKFSVVSTNSSDRDLVLHKRINSGVPNYSTHTVSPIQKMLSEKNGFRPILSTPNSSSELNVSFSSMPTTPTSLSELLMSSMSTTTETLSKLNSNLTLPTMAAFTGIGLIDSGSTESTIIKNSRKIDSESTTATSLNKLIDPVSTFSKIPPSSTKPSDIASAVSKIQKSLFQTSEYGDGSIQSKILDSLAELIKPSTVMSTVPSIGLNNLVPSNSSIPASLNGSTNFVSSSTTFPNGSSDFNNSSTVSSIPKMEMTTSTGTPEGLQNLTDLMSEHEIISESLYEKGFSTSTMKSTNMHSQNNSTYTMFVEQTTRFNPTTLPPTFNDTPVLNFAETKTNDAAIPTEINQTSSKNLKKIGTFTDYYEIIPPFESLEHFSTNMSASEETLLA